MSLKTLGRLLCSSATKSQRPQRTCTAIKPESLRDQASHGRLFQAPKPRSSVFGDRFAGIDSSYHRPMWRSFLHNLISLQKPRSNLEKPGAFSCMLLAEQKTPTRTRPCRARLKVIRNQTRGAAGVFGEAHRSNRWKAGSNAAVIGKPVDHHGMTLNFRLDLIGNGFSRWKLASLGWMYVARQFVRRLHAGAVAMANLSATKGDTSSGGPVLCWVPTANPRPSGPNSGWVSSSFSALGPRGWWACIWAYYWALSFNPGLLGFRIWDPGGSVEGQTPANKWMHWFPDF